MDELVCRALVVVRIGVEELQTHAKSSFHATSEE